MGKQKSRSSVGNIAALGADEEDLMSQHDQYERNVERVFDRMASQEEEEEEEEETMGTQASSSTQVPADTQDLFSDVPSKTKRNARQEEEEEEKEEEKQKKKKKKEKIQGSQEGDQGEDQGEDQNKKKPPKKSTGGGKGGKGLGAGSVRASKKNKKKVPSEVKISAAKVKYFSQLAGISMTEGKYPQMFLTALLTALVTYMGKESADYLISKNLKSLSPLHATEIVKRTEASFHLSEEFEKVIERFTAEWETVKAKRKSASEERYKERREANEKIYLEEKKKYTEKFRQ